MSRRDAGIAYDERSGLKVKGTKLRQDYYTKAWTTDADGPHPQDFVRAPGPDGVNRPYGPRDQHAINTASIIGQDYFDTGTMTHVRWPGLSLNTSIVLVGDNA